MRGAAIKRSVDWYAKPTRRDGSRGREECSDECHEWPSSRFRYSGLFPVRPAAWHPMSATLHGHTSNAYRACDQPRCARRALSRFRSMRAERAAFERHNRGTASEFQPSQPTVIIIMPPIVYKQRRFRRRGLSRFEEARIAAELRSRVHLRDDKW